jgi:COP9 signalosome complex subunit 1
VIDVQAISEFARPQDLAFYVVICTLKSLNRSDIKNTIMQASGFKTLMELSSSSGNLEDVLENFLNGHYMDFQRQIAQIMSQMSFDMYLGGSKINTLMNDIRRKALIQYVAPYKVIDLREIAKAFDLSVE